jgi:hypothetical protein
MGVPLASFLARGRAFAASPHVMFAIATWPLRAIRINPSRGLQPFIKTEPETHHHHRGSYHLVLS